jgi:hypothetical protein
LFQQQHVILLHLVTEETVIVDHLAVLNDLVEDDVTLVQSRLHLAVVADVIHTLALLHAASPERDPIPAIDAAILADAVTHADAAPHADAAIHVDAAILAVEAIQEALHLVVADHLVAVDHLLVDTVDHPLLDVVEATAFHLHQEENQFQDVKKMCIKCDILFFLFLKITAAKRIIRLL